MIDVCHSGEKQRLGLRVCCFDGAEAISMIRFSGQRGYIESTAVSHVAETGSRATRKHNASERGTIRMRIEPGPHAPAPRAQTLPRPQHEPASARHPAAHSEQRGEQHQKVSASPAHPVIKFHTLGASPISAAPARSAEESPEPSAARLQRALRRGHGETLNSPSRVH